MWSQIGDKISMFVHKVTFKKEQKSKEPDKYFKEIKDLNNKFNLPEISMGMSSDYLKAVENSSTYLRIGSSIFGLRNQ